MSNVNRCVVVDILGKERIFTDAYFKLIHSINTLEVHASGVLYSFNLRNVIYYYSIPYNPDSENTWTM